MSARAKFDRVVPWLFFLYGLFSVGLEAAFTSDEIAIATGVETVLLSLVDFLWAGELFSLSIALFAAAALSPLLLWGSSPLFYDDASLGSDAFAHSMALGGVLALPLALLGVLARRADKRGDVAEDSRAMRALRWGFRGGLFLIVLALRLGEWSGGGVALVYAGAALAVAAVAIVLPRRVRTGRAGAGAVLLVLGVAALLAIGAAKVAVGGHLSGEEAAVGAAPAALIAAVGAALMLASPRGRSSRR